jgi:hypothetical protein
MAGWRARSAGSAGIGRIGRISRISRISRVSRISRAEKLPGIQATGEPEQVHHTNVHSARVYHKVRFMSSDGN